ncbi:MAG: protein translocase subunit SecF [bacterium]|nr:protein translocase subunit SecF [bacterium]
MFQFFKQTNIDFVGSRKYAYGVIAVFILIGLISLSVWGLKWSIDFGGGTLVEVKFSQPVKTDAIRAGLAKIQLGESTIQQVELSGVNYIIRAGTAEQASEQTGNLIVETLRANFPNQTIEVLRRETVGASVSRDFTERAVWAVVWASLGMIAYMAWRFQFKYAVAGIFAMLHDVFIVIGLLTLFQKEISLVVIAGILTVMGYSINDSIIIYDRIRENQRLHRKLSFMEIINLSINQTLSRTILTVLTVLIVSLCLFFFGGQVIRDFAFTMILGIITGTFSSIYVASPIIFEWINWERRHLKR